MPEETEYIQKIREKLRQAAHPESPLGRMLPRLGFEQRFRGRVSKQDGSLDYEKLYRAMGVGDQETTILVSIIRLGMTPEEVHELVKYRFRTCNGPENDIDQTGPTGGVNMTLLHYPRWCANFDIVPDPNFPDWGNREAARRSLDEYQRGLERRIG